MLLSLSCLVAEDFIAYLVYCSVALSCHGRFYSVSFCCSVVLSCRALSFILLFMSLSFLSKLLLYNFLPDFFFFFSFRSYHFFSYRLSSQDMLLSLKAFWIFVKVHRISPNDHTISQEMVVIHGSFLMSCTFGRPLHFQWKLSFLSPKIDYYTSSSKIRKLTRNRNWQKFCLNKGKRI